MGIPLKVLCTSESSSPVTMRSARAAIANANTASSSASREIGLSSWRETPVVKQHLFSAAPSGLGLPRHTVRQIQCDFQRCHIESFFTNDHLRPIRNLLEHDRSRHQWSCVVQCLTQRTLLLAVRAACPVYLALAQRPGQRHKSNPNRARHHTTCGPH